MCVHQNDAVSFLVLLLMYTSVTGQESAEVSPSLTLDLTKT